MISLPKHTLGNRSDPQHWKTFEEEYTGLPKLTPQAPMNLRIPLRQYLRKLFPNQ